MRRAVLTAACALLVAGCGGSEPEGLRDLRSDVEFTPAEQRELRDYVLEQGELNDRELARVCPSLYPRDFNEDPERYGVGEVDLEARPGTQGRPAACTKGRAQPLGTDEDETPAGARDGATTPRGGATTPEDEEGR